MLLLPRASRPTLPLPLRLCRRASGAPFKSILRQTNWYDDEQEHQDFKAAWKSVSYRGKATDTTLSASEIGQFRATWAQPQQEVDRDLSQAIVTGAIDSLEHLKAGIASGSVTEKTLHTCLQAQFEKISQEKTRGADNKSAIPIPLARTILAHVWKDIDLWPTVSIGRSGALLCYFAVDEGLGGAIENWIFAELQAEKVAILKQNPDAWRGTLFRVLIEAHCMHAPDRSFDGPLLCFFRTVRRKDLLRPRNAESAGRVSPAMVSAWPASVELCNRLSTQDCSLTNADAFEHFVRFYDQFTQAHQRTPLSCAYKSAGLRLHHPTKSTPVAALVFLSQHVQHDGRWEGKPLWKSLAVTSSLFREFLNRTRQLALRDGLIEDAAWVERQIPRLLHGINEDASKHREGSQS